MSTTEETNIPQAVPFAIRVEICSYDSWEKTAGEIASAGARRWAGAVFFRSECKESGPASAEALRVVSEGIHELGAHRKPLL
jgi:hypothetical protein